MVHHTITLSRRDGVGDEVRVLRKAQACAAVHVLHRDRSHKVNLAGVAPG